MTRALKNQGISAPSVYPRDALIDQLFVEQARRTPSAIALQIGEKRLTYAELDQAAEKLAAQLRELGVRADTLVGIYLPRSLGLIVGLLGILKAGGAYVALNEGDPRPHLASIIDDTKMPVLVTAKELLALLPYDSGHVVCLDADGVITNCSDHGSNGSVSRGPSLGKHESPRHALNLAYVSYTSGSTGPPKGVCIPHRGVVRLVKNTNYAQFSQNDVFLQLSRISFDTSTFELWGALLNGARLVIFPPEPVSHTVLRDLIRSEGITTLWLTAGLFHQIVQRDVDTLQGVRQLLAGGDILSKPVVQRAAERLKGCQVINAYGPTEATTFASFYPISLPLPEINSVPIGKPISNTSLYVIDSDGQPVPFGETGELAIGGDGLARGYLNSPELTDEKFITVNFEGEPNLRLYRTGDQVRFLPDGNLEFFGRIDRQVKLRGFRVELPAIEATLEKHTAVYEAAVLARGQVGQKRLEAYIVPKPGSVLTTKALQEFLRDQLPGYMIPPDFFYLSEMPLSPNGKVNYAALPELRQALDVDDGQEANAPETSTEKILTQLWSEAVGRKDVRIDQRFFDAGGDSLQAVGLVLGVEQRLHKRLPLGAVGTGTIRSLAAMLDRITTSTDDDLPEYIVPMNNQAAAHRPPLFLVPGQAGDDLSCYVHLVANFPPTQVVHGLQPRGVVAHEFETIEETADYYIQAMRQSQPSGPYFLCGFCYGGLVAFEMAQQLQAMGERVDFLGIIDHRLETNEPQWKPRHIYKFLQNFFYAIVDFIQVKEERAATLRRWLKPSNAPPTNEQLLTTCAQSVVHADEIRRRLEIQARALQRYQLHSYSGPVTVFRARRLPVQNPYDESLGWNKLVTDSLDIQKLPVPGFQGYMLRPPYAAILAQRLARALELAHLKSDSLSPKAVRFAK